MQIEQLDLDTRSKIYDYTKKILRKYQKGISTGKLTADRFASNILLNNSLSDIVSDDLLSKDEFKDSYKSYIETLICIQNETLSRSYKTKSALNKPTATQKVALRKLLLNSGYILCMPDEYLNSSDIDSIMKYINTGCIDLGNEKIYKYVSKERLT